MKSKMLKIPNLPKRNSVQKGFIALIALMLLGTGVLVFALTTLTSAATYADSVSRKEIRIQTQFDAQSCLETVSIMLAKDFFLNGNVSLPQFNCIAYVTNSYSSGTASVSLVTTISNVTSYGSRIFTFNGDLISGGVETVN